jgi:hypothetical protein
MAQDQGTGNGEAAAPADAPQWLMDLRARSALMRKRRERPAGLCFGRWLGDFLDQDTPSGLLHAEERLLFSAANGGACVLQSRAGRLWAEFDGWRKQHSMREAPDLHSDAGFAEALAKYIGGAPESVQEVVHEATMRAVVGIGLPADWEPKDAAETAKLAALQHEYFKQLEAEAYPARTLAAARTSDGFYKFASEAVCHAFAPPPPHAVKLQDDWFAPLLRNDPFNLPKEIREKIEDQPRVVRGFFAELIRHLKHWAGADVAWPQKLKEQPRALRPHFDAVFERYEREGWRRIDPDDPEVRVRAGFLRFLAQGGDESAPVHERALELHGAYVAEDLDLSGCTIPQPLFLRGCYFEGQILLTEAAAKSLDLSTSRVRSIAGQGARISGGVAFDNGFRSCGGTAFPNAAIEGRLSCEGGTFVSENAPAIDCSGARIAGDACLSEGFLSEGRVCFSGASAGGSLNCAGGTFRNRTENGEGVALDCSDAKISGNATLANGFRSEGMVSFPGAKIGGALNCKMGTFVNHTRDGKGKALSFESAQIEDGVYLRHGFLAEGEVRFHGARIKANFECDGGRLVNPVLLESGANVAWNNALNLVRATIDGTLWMGPRAGDALSKAKFVGSVNLAGAHAHEISDHPSVWPIKGAGKATHTYIHLDGFTYDRLAGGDHSAGTRKRWLDRQPPAHLGLEFRPQPFAQLVRVYREMGHEGRARDIAKFKERRRRRARFIKLWHGWRGRPRFWMDIFGGGFLSSALDGLSWPFALLGRAFSRTAISALFALEWAVVGFGAAYGYGYFRLGAFLLVLWLMGGVIYEGAASQSAFAPSNPALYLNKELQAKCGENWTRCSGAPAEMPGFSPYIYSLDVMLPGLDLGQKHDWQPVYRPDRRMRMGLPRFTSKPEEDPDRSIIPRFSFEAEPLAEGTLDTIVRTQMLLSWLALGLLFSILSGIIKKD